VNRSRPSPEALPPGAVGGGLVVPRAVASEAHAAPRADLPGVGGAAPVVEADDEALSPDAACPAETSDQPAAVAHQLAVGQLVHLAPSLDAAREDAEPAVRRGRPTRVEAGARGEPVTPLLWQRVDLEDLDFAIDHGHVAGVAQPQPNGSGGGEVPAGRAVRRRGNQQCLAVPVEGQRHQVRRTVRRGTGHPDIDVVGEPMLGVATTLSAGAGLWSWAQLTALFTSALIFASSAAVNSFSAKEVGHMAPSSRFASSLKPSVAYLELNFCAPWKKQRTLPSLLA
jgi:hypothetical protein